LNSCKLPVKHPRLLRSQESVEGVGGSVDLVVVDAEGEGGELVEEDPDPGRSRWPFDEPDVPALALGREGLGAGDLRTGRADRLDD
jgi:hypothetical protein